MRGPRGPARRSTARAPPGGPHDITQRGRKGPRLNSSSRKRPSVRSPRRRTTVSHAAQAIPRAHHRLVAVLAVLAVVSSATPAHAQSQPAASPTVVTNASAVYSVPTTSKPAYLKTFTDPTFSTRLMRIASDPGTSTSPAPGTWGSDTRHHYSEDEPWSADGALYSIDNRGGATTQLILVGRTFAPLFG